MNNTTHTRPTAFLVNIANTHALVDAANGLLFVLDDTAAEAWRDLAAGVAPRTPLTAAFATELTALGLLPAELARPQGDLVPVLDEDEPRILAQAPLQVAAGTSDPNPFSADAIW